MREDVEREICALRVVNHSAGFIIRHLSRKGTTKMVATGAVDDMNKRAMMEREGPIPS
jgi:hypothetical protein